MTQPGTTLRTNPADEIVRMGPLTMRFLVTGAESKGSIACAELTVAAEARLMAPAHSHDRYEETIYGLEGVLTWTVDGNPIDVGPGEMLCIPRGAVHRFDNHRSQDTKCMCVITPAAIGPEYFREVAALAAGGPPDPAQMVKLMLRYGLTPALPQA
jgi:quercetin dioxygenase-like cupin family protein